MKILAATGDCNLEKKINPFFKISNTEILTINNTGAVTIKITDDDDTLWVGLQLVGTNDGIIGKSTFNTSGTVTNVLISLLECLRLNNIFYDFSIDTQSNKISFLIDNSRNYNISSSNSNITVSISNPSNNSNSSNSSNSKITLVKEWWNDNKWETIIEDKYINTQRYNFDISSGFSFNVNPIHVRIKTSYTIVNNMITPVIYNETDYYILPTSLSYRETGIFTERYDYSNDNTIEQVYLYDYNIPNSKVRYLTFDYLTPKRYNYNETSIISILKTPDTQIKTMSTKYYTESGVYITTITSSPIYFSFSSDIIVNLTFKLNINDVETNYNKQVGYSLVNVLDINNNEILIEPVRYNINPSCNKNFEVFYLNSMGGMESFNFLYNIEQINKVGETLTHTTNNILMQINSHNPNVEIIKTKQHSNTYRATTEYVTKEEAKKIMEITDSKYVYVLDGYNHNNIIPEKMDMTLDEKKNKYRVAMEFRYADQILNY